MERELFSWTGWDGDSECMVFYDPVLKVQIGEYPPGTKFDSASVLVNQDGSESGVLQFHNKGKPFKEGKATGWEIDLVAEFRLHYRIGEKIEKH